MADEKDALTSEKCFFQIACAQATKVSKSVANMRGSWGTPDRIHDMITQMVT